MSHFWKSPVKRRYGPASSRQRTISGESRGTHHEMMPKRLNAMKSVSAMRKGRGIRLAPLSGGARGAADAGPLGAGGGVCFLDIVPKSFPIVGRTGGFTPYRDARAGGASRPCGPAL